jgi:hypothetical protein
MPVTAVIKHRVDDYGAWREVYDGFAPSQRAVGVTHESVHQAAGDPNEVLVIHGFGTLTEAETFLGSAELRETMQRAGVAGAPRIEIYQDA